VDRGTVYVVEKPAERHVAMTWMQRLKRVFNIDFETCERCAGQVKIIVEASNRCIEDTAVIERILSHLKGKETSAESELAMLPDGRAPPKARLFD
jgi:DNA-binding transcriptional regulator YbjK